MGSWLRQPNSASWTQGGEFARQQAVTKKLTHHIRCWLGLFCLIRVQLFFQKFDNLTRKETFFITQPKCFLNPEHLLPRPRPLVGSLCEINPHTNFNPPPNQSNNPTWLRYLSIVLFHIFSSFLSFRSQMNFLLKRSAFFQQTLSILSKEQNSTSYLHLAIMLHSLRTATVQKIKGNTNLF